MRHARNPQRSLVALVGIAALSAVPALGQQGLHALDCPTTQHGTLHFASGQFLGSGGWTSTGGGSLAGADTDVIYANNCAPGGWYNQCGDSGFYDSGRLPMPDSMDLSGDQSSYRVTGVGLAYVTSALDSAFGGSGATVRIVIYESFLPCGHPVVQGEPTHVLDLHGLPASATAGQASAHYLRIDLSGSGLEFCMRAEGDGAYDSDPWSDSFGYGLYVLNEPGEGAGFIIAGDPLICGIGDGTRWQNPSQPGTGFGNQDSLYYFNPDYDSQCSLWGPSRCFDLSSQAHQGLYFELLSSAAGECTDPGEASCFGTSNCYCGNFDPHAGCANTTGVGARMDATGSASIASDDLQLQVSQLPALTWCLLVTSASPWDQTFGSGRLCLGQTGMWRYARPRQADSAGNLDLGPGLLLDGFTHSVPFQSGQTWIFQLWYRDTGICDYLGAYPCNLSNAYSVLLTP